MKVKGIVDEDYSNYKKCSMFVIFPTCSLKCDKENKSSHCQNSSLLKEPNIDITYRAICERYVKNPLSHSMVLGGLEPFDSLDDIVGLIRTLRYEFDCQDDIVIYTGYTPGEIVSSIMYLRYKQCLPVIIKFGRFRPYQAHHHDEILGVELANDEQYARWIT